MERFFGGVIKHRKKILVCFIIMLVIAAICKPFISVNYDINDYLPEDVPSSVALDVMEDEFDGGIPNMRVMIRDISLAEALEYKEKISEVSGVTDVTWLDDSVDITVPLETADSDVVDNYYKDGTALYQITITEDKVLTAVSDIRDIIGDENSMTGSAVNTALATSSTVDEVRKIAIFSILLVFFILFLTTNSFVEPFVVMAGLGLAVMINAGSNLIFGEISFVTNAAGNILQLAVSLDYSVFLIHRFEECKGEQKNPEIAMKDALVKSVSSIMSSGLTTVIGFLALAFMRFKIGPDLGLALAKGVAISLIVVFVFMPGLILLTAPYMDKTRHKVFIPDFRWFGKIVGEIARPMAILFAVMIVPSYLASINNSYYYGASHIFEKGTQMGDDTAAIEEVFGKSDTYVLMVPKGDTATETDMVSDIKKIPLVSGVIAFVEQAGAEVPYEYLDEDTLSKLESENYSRMVISVDADYEGDETFRLIDDIRKTADKYYPDKYYLAGEGVSTYDLMDTVTADMTKVNVAAVVAVFIVLLLTMKSFALPVILVLTIETAIWINLSVTYYAGTPLFYIAYLIISSIQLGATVDYAILLTERYKENRQILNKKDGTVETLRNVTVSILTSGAVLTIVGFLLGKISTHGLLSQLGMLLGRGTVCSLFAVLFILPGFLYLFDRFLIKRKGGINNE